MRSPTTKRCPSCGKTKPLVGFYKRSGWCKTCTNSRPKKQTSKRLIRSRARHRAYQALAKMHPDTFQQLYQECLANAEVEAEVLSVVADRADQAAARLRPGRRHEDEDPVDRIDTTWCVECSTYHEAGHVCPTCTEKTSKLSDEDLVDEVQHLIGTDSSGKIAARLGTTQAGLARRLRKIGHPRLAARIERSSTRAA